MGLGAIFIALMPIQDFVLQTTPLGFLAASLSFIVIPFMIFNRLRSRKIHKGERVYFIIVFLLTLYSFVIGLMEILYRPSTFEFSSGLKLLILFIFSTYPLAFYWDTEIKNLKKGLSTSLIILIFGVILVDIFKADMVGLFHLSEVQDKRLRGFSSESSIFGMTVATITLCWLGQLKNVRELPALVSLILILWICGSKGAIFAFFAALFFHYLSQIKINMRYMVAIILLFTVGSFSIYQAILDLAADIENYNSFSTRATFIVSSLNLIMDYPFGVGFFGYYSIGKAAVSDVLLGYSLNIKEVETIILTGTNYGFKSGAAELLVIGGIPLLTVFLYFFYKLYKRSENMMLRLALLFSLFSFMTYVSFIGFYAMLLPIIVSRQKVIGCGKY